MSALGRYSDALEAKWATVRMWSSREGVEAANDLVSGRGADGELKSPAEFAEIIAHLVTRADVYWVGQQVSRLLIASAASLPSAALSESLIPSQVGWVYFEDSLPLALDVDDLDFCVDPGLAALSWGFVNGCFVLLAYARHHPHADVRRAGCSRASLTPGGFFNWPIGQSWDENTVAGDVPLWPSAIQVRRYVYALLHFISTTILERQSLSAERHVRKRLAREQIEPEPIHVVQLRRRSVQTGPRAEGEPVEWSCQWIVRGHWRQQWMPSLSAHQPRWILPHIKGPENKPLKPPTERVFAVVR